MQGHKQPTIAQNCICQYSVAKIASFFDSLRKFILHEGDWLVNCSRIITIHHDIARG